MQHFAPYYTPNPNTGQPGRNMHAHPLTLLCEPQLCAPAAAAPLFTPPHPTPPRATHAHAHVVFGLDERLDGCGRCTLRLQGLRLMMSRETSKDPPQTYMRTLHDAASRWDERQVTNYPHPYPQVGWGCRDDDVMPQHGVVWCGVVRTTKGSRCRCMPPA